MLIDGEVRSIYALRHDEIVLRARMQADAGEPCSHGFQIGSPQACAWERNYTARRMELEQHDLPV